MKFTGDAYVFIFEYSTDWINHEIDFQHYDFTRQKSLKIMNIANIKH